MAETTALLAGNPSSRDEQSQTRGIHFEILDRRHHLIGYIGVGSLGMKRLAAPELLLGR